MLKKLAKHILRDELFEMRKDLNIEQSKRVSDQTEIRRLKAELMGAERRLQRTVAIVDAGVGDPEPQGEGRADYVMNVANFYDGVLHSKLLQLIAVARENLDTWYQDMPPGIDRTRYDDLLRGTTNAFKIIMDWCELLKGEHLSNVNTQGSNE